MKWSVLIIRSSILTSAGRRKYHRSKIAAAGAMMFQGAVKCCEIKDTWIIHTPVCFCVCVRQDRCIFGHCFLWREGRYCGRAEARCQWGRQLPVDEQGASGTPFPVSFIEFSLNLWNSHFGFLMINQLYFITHFPSPVGYRQHPSGGPLLPGSSSRQHPAKNPSGWNSHIWHQAVLLRWQPAPMQYPNVSSHVCHQPAQAPPEAARCVESNNSVKLI